MLYLVESNLLESPKVSLLCYALHQSIVDFSFVFMCFVSYSLHLHDIFRTFKTIQSSSASLTATLTKVCTITISH